MRGSQSALLRLAALLQRPRRVQALAASSHEQRRVRALPGQKALALTFPRDTALRSDVGCSAVPRPPTDGDGDSVVA
jgi:hypothetical protein